MDATFIAVLRQRTTKGAPAQIEEGRTAAEIGPEARAKARQEVDGCWTIELSKACAKGTAQIDTAVRLFGTKTRISIDRMHGVIRHQITADAPRHDGLVQQANTA